MSDDLEPRTEAAVEIVVAYVSNNQVPASELPALIASVRAVLASPVDQRATGASEPVELTPAVPIKKSITPDYLISLEDGKKFKSLRRYLATSYGMTPEDYRKKWGLPADYPMVAPNYAAARSAFARSMGLGRRRAEEPVPEPVVEEAPVVAETTKVRRGRSKKSK